MNLTMFYHNIIQISSVFHFQYCLFWKLSNRIELRFVVLARLHQGYYVQTMNVSIFVKMSVKKQNDQGCAVKLSLT